MAHIPYGYRIVDGKAVIDEKEALKVRELFRKFLEFGTISETARAVNIDKTHSVISNILKNKTYLGTSLYPSLLDEETFYKVQQLRANNFRRKPRTTELKPLITTNFTYEIGVIEKKYDDPYRQAAYAYSQIKGGVK